MQWNLGRYFSLLHRRQCLLLPAPVPSPVSLESCRSAASFVGLVDECAVFNEQLCNVKVSGSKTTTLSSVRKIPSSAYPRGWGRDVGGVPGASSSRPPAKTDLAAITGILRLSHKYDVQYLRKALLHLDTGYPTSLAVYEVPAPNVLLRRRQPAPDLVRVRDACPSLVSFASLFYFLCNSDILNCERWGALSEVDPEMTIGAYGVVCSIIQIFPSRVWRDGRLSGFNLREVESPWAGEPFYLWALPVRRRRGRAWCGEGEGEVGWRLRRWDEYSEDGRWRSLLVGSWWLADEERRFVRAGQTCVCDAFIGRAGGARHQLEVWRGGRTRADANAVFCSGHNNDTQRFFLGRKVARGGCIGWRLNAESMGESETRSEIGPDDEQRARFCGATRRWPADADGDGQTNNADERKRRYGMGQNESRTSGVRFEPT
ncbi:hypothetical protein C8J57DRAFT_1232389 [Mycena rebaudengoi]|nr:hypothetical protein C8J57DRAFT_1232389 [Mycena rebaudengoi]